MTISKKTVLPQLSVSVAFLDREAMRIGHPEMKLKLSGEYPKPALPIDWTKNDTLQFPLFGNGGEEFGDCMYAAACHGDQTFTGNTGAEQQFDLATLLKDYTLASGGDNGLNAGQIISCWNKGLAGVHDANILAASDVDPTDAAAMQAAIYLFGGVFFMLAVPDTWLNLTVDGLWDAPATPDSKNGHGVWINGVDVNGNYKVQTWGIHGWMTPAGVKDCNPSAFAVFSNRWFEPGGLAPNGHTFNELAALWRQFGAKLPYPDYQTPNLQLATTFTNELDGVWLMADYDRDGIPDLVFVKTSNTPSGKVEVHIASGASNFQSRILETPTTFDCEQDGAWLMADYDGDGRPDLIFVKTANTPSGRVEVHVASAASGYQKRVFEAPTTFAAAPGGVWAMIANGHGVPPDLAFIRTDNTPSGCAEVHIASGKSGYLTRTLETATLIPNGGAGSWVFCDYDGSSPPDLCFIETAATGTGDVELHIAKGSSKYVEWALQTPTAYALESDGTWTMTPWKGVDKPVLVFIKTANTPSGKVEVHTAHA